MTDIIKILDRKLFGINVAISSLFVIGVLFLYPEIDTNEDGIVESTQSLFIGLSMFIFAYHAFSVQDIHTKLASFAFLLLSLTFLLRELDVETFDIPSVFILLGSGAGRNILLISLWIVLLVLTFKYKGFSKNKVVQLLLSIQGQILMFSAFMLVLGAMMDRNVFSLEHLMTRFYEELFELLGYVYLSFSAFIRVKYKYDML